VTVVHSRTPNGADICREADIVVAACGKAEMITGDWIKDGAVVIDVGINAVDVRTSLHLAPEPVSQPCEASTPVYVLHSFLVRVTPCSMQAVSAPCSRLLYHVVQDATAKRGYRLVGDVKFSEAKEKAALITPVPGGVGPMTIAMLLSNTLTGFKRTIS
jgi:5,10-methylene-tetrahydrofolate dehydrogenase/methenyl tetrahydrofolate cyclohydrolase